MIVKEVMKQGVATCAPDDTLTAAVATMQDRHCGFLPVVDSHGDVVGVLTDRDACLAAAVHQHRTMGHIAVKEAMSKPVVNGLVDENLKAALVTMAKHRVRRLPVIDSHGRLHGVVSIDDIVQAPRRRGSPTAEDIVEALKAICAPRTVEPVVA